MSELIRVLVVDDHPVVQQGLSGLITPRYGMSVIGQATDGNQAVEQARFLQPDVILMDLVMPHKTGLEAIQEIRQENPEARILVLTSFGEEEQVTEAIKAGALGYLMKDSSPDELIHAIGEVFRGNLSLPQGVALKLMQDLQQPKQSDLPPEATLTERELEVLTLIVQGLSNKQIASQLSISEVTVRFHVSSILDKLQVENRVQAAVYAVQKGLVEPDS